MIAVQIDSYGLFRASHSPDPGVINAHYDNDAHGALRFSGVQPVQGNE